MRCRLAQIVIFVACLLAGKPHVQAQSAVPETQSGIFCPTSSALDDKRPSGPEISIAEVTFSGSLQMAASDQDQIAVSIKQRTHGNSVDEVTDGALERVRAGWQDQGYFKVQVSDEARTLTSSPASQRIALDVHVDEGPQYRLGAITFKNNKAISSVEVLRRLFPINDSDIFSREKIAKGLENLRVAYGELGYINFTSIPDPMADDEQRLVSLCIDLVEGKQFYVSSINILGLDEASRQEILKDFPAGQVYNQRLFNLFVEEHSSILKFALDDPRHGERRLDERAGTVEIVLDARPCPD